MGCFSTCFRKSNRRRSNRSRRFNRQPCLLDQLQKDDFLEPLQVHKSIEQESVEKPMDPIPESKDEEKEKENSSGRKKVTFDLNVKIYEQVKQTNEEEGDENKEKEEEEEERAAADSCSSQCHSDSSNSSSLFSYPPNYRYQNCRDSDDELASDDASDMDDDDDYLEDEEEEDGDGDVDEVNDEVLVENESSGSSLFSLSINSRNQKFGADNNNKEEVNSPMLIKNPCCRGELRSTTGLLGLDQNEPEGERTKIVIDSVLNPVENLDQWHAVKARAKLTAASKRQSKSKENINGGADPRNRLGMTPKFKTREEEEEEEPRLNLQKQKSIESKQEIITVDTSLSSWLGVSEATATTPNSRDSSGAGVASSAVNSVGSYSSVLLSDDRVRSSPRKYDDDRPILGALTVEEIRQFSATSSPCRRSPSRSPDDMPIIGTVGSYWSHTGQGSSANDKSESAGSVSSTTRRIKYTEDDKVYWNPIPFETRLETALQKGIPQA